jgi:hypothetical protein
MAAGIVAEELSNLSVAISWTPGQTGYAVTFFGEDGEALEGHEYHANAKAPFEINPKEGDLDMRVYEAMLNVYNDSAKFVQMLSGFGLFKWFSPAGMTNKARAMYGGIDK